MPKFVEGSFHGILLGGVGIQMCVGQAAEVSLERERHALSETRMDLTKRAEGAEKRCESLQGSAVELTQKLQDAERRFQKVQGYFLRTQAV